MTFCARAANQPSCLRALLHLRSVSDTSGSTLTIVPLLASFSGSRDSFAVLVTAHAPGVALLSVRAESARAASNVSLSLAVVEPLPEMLHPDLSTPSPMLVLPNATIGLMRDGLLDDPNELGGELHVEFSLCDDSADSGASIEPGGVLHAASREGPLCGLVTLSPPQHEQHADAEDDIPQSQLLLFEVSHVAAIQLFFEHAEGEHSLHFNGALSNASSRVCALVGCKRHLIVITLLAGLATFAIRLA